MDMASTSTLGMPSRSPLPPTRHGRQKTPASRISAYIPARLGVGLEATGVDAAPEPVGVFPEASDDAEVDVEPLVAQDGAGLDQQVEALLDHEPAHPKVPQAAAGGSVAGRQGRPCAHQG